MKPYIHFPYAIEELRQLLERERPFLDPLDPVIPLSVQMVDAFLCHFTAWHIRALADYLRRGGVFEEWMVNKVPDVESVGGVMGQPLASLTVPEHFWDEEETSTLDS